MNVPISFTKASGAGNDFVLVNTITEDPASTSAFCRCRLRQALRRRSRRTPSPRKKRQGGFTMRYFNADGSSGGMCGNGGRCIARLR